ncbi:hypothetical protein [Desulfosporosinus nitroreducens]|uniref:hypothetical protein n=1 Tax=Desulfosporosinus nitroreducens TaxID=2018668 RepID=UPI00207C2352|nr:hypothetical protein [Desulfosporosinus nitroreducens]MCO1599864.1 hypothetical protein [Desulfosporosinus nitroreducens]
MKKLTPTCLCGYPMMFKPGQTRTFCKNPGCSVVQEKVEGGYWATGWTRSVFTPILAKPPKLNHYQKYMRWRNSNGKRR